MIDDEDVKKILMLDDVMDALEEAFRQYGMGRAGGDGFRYGFIPPPKRELRIKGKGMPHGFPGNVSIGQGMASLEDTKLAVLQHSFSFPKRKSSMFHLIDAESGDTLALVMNNESYISWMRTGAEGAIAAKYLSRTDCKVAGVIGTGRQGRAQLQFLVKVRQLEKVYAYSGRRRDEEFANEMSKTLGLDVVATNDAEEVVRNAEVLTTVTHSTVPIVRGDWVEEGTHINGIGADCPLKAELDASTIQKTDKLVIDCEQVLDVADLRAPIEQGVMHATSIYGTIGEIVAGVKPGRQHPSEITVYKSTGMTIPYVTIAAKIYEKAKNMGLGTEVSSFL